MATSCEEARLICESHGGTLTYCAESADLGIVDSECVVMAPGQPFDPAAAAAAAGAAAGGRAGQRAGQQVISPDAPPPQKKKASALPWVIGGAAVIGIGYYLLR